MELEQHQGEVQAVSAELAPWLIGMLEPYQTLSLNLADWLKLLALVFPRVSEARYESGKVSRRFYDEQRKLHIPDEPVPDVWLANYEFPEFVEATAEHRKELSRPDLNDFHWDNEVAKFAGTVMNQVDNGSRMTLAEAAIKDDAAGYARIDPVGPTCAWCTMLISRGPAYTAEEYKKGTWQWHNFDTCIMTVVFDPEDWPGKEQYEEAERLYKAAAKAEGDTLKNLREMVSG